MLKREIVVWFDGESVTYTLAELGFNPKKDKSIQKFLEERLADFDSWGWRFV